MKGIKDKWIVELFANELDTCLKKEFESEDEAEDWLFDYMEGSQARGLPYGYNIYNQKAVRTYPLEARFLAPELL